jgi:hypothetical protein
MKTNTPLHFLQPRWWVILLIFCFIPTGFVVADGLWGSVGARSAGMNESTVALHDFWNIQNNQAGIANINQLTLGLAYQNQFGLNEMALRSLAIVVPVKWGVTGMSMHYFGYSLYSEMKMGFTFARSFGHRFRLGMQLDYLQTRYGENYGKTQDLTFELGMQADLTPNLSLGTWIFNPLTVKFASYQSGHLPIVFRFGMAYHFSKSLVVTAQAEKNSDFNQLSLRTGVEYLFDKRYAFRLGCGTGAEIFSMGFGLYLGRLQFDLAARMHASLGFSPQASLQYNF